MSDSAGIDFDRVWEAATDAFLLASRWPHGPNHWRRVEEAGLLLAARNGADAIVVRLFAILHDCQREGDGRDPEHGRRAASFARGLRGKAFHLTADRFALLEETIARHADGLISTDVTVGTCWDADRLDLPRVGVRPSPHLLSTPAAREMLRSLSTGRP